MGYNYSVVIPYHDRYELFLKAFESIPDRSDIQIIIIDNSPEFLKEESVPTKQNANVFYTTSSPYLGAGHARNIGLKHIKGQNILFLDADDYFTENAFCVFDKYKDEGYDIVFFNADSVFLDGGSQSTRHEYIKEYVSEYIDNGNEERLRYRFFNPIAKMFKSDFIINGGVLFEEIPVSNDVWFSLMTGHLAGRIIADSSVVYMITEGGHDSSLTKKRTQENMFVRFEVEVRVNKFLKSIGKSRLRIRLLGALKIALYEFGIKEFFRYLAYALHNRVSVL